MTGVTLEKISDSDKCMFFEQGMTGGVSYINKRYSKASKNVNILYLDMNNYMDVQWDNIYLAITLNGSNT